MVLKVKLSGVPTARFTAVTVPPVVSIVTVPVTAALSCRVAFAVNTTDAACALRERDSKMSGQT